MPPLRCPADALPLLEDAGGAGWACEGGHRYPERDGVLELLPGGHAPGFGRLRAATYNLTFDLINVRRLFGARPRDVRELHRDAARAARGGILLDVACGTSRWALPHLQPEGVATYLGVDSAMPMLRLAARAARRRRGLDARLVHSEAQRLPLREGSVDAAISSLGLQFVAELPEALAELRRVLRRGGGLFAVAPALGLRARYDRRHQERARRDFPLELARWPAQLEAAGFDAPDVRIVGALVFTRARAA
ncbi:MAG: methyltransferase domain-containing protein [Kofleriaceae bacterium]